MNQKKLLKISEIAKKAGVLASTIRYYTDLGLVDVSGHTEGGHRLYSEEVVLPRIRRIRWFLEHKGYSIEKIKEEITATKGVKRILIIDDEPEISELVVDLVKDKFPNEIKIVYDGFAAGRLLNDFLPDLVVLDLLLPGVNGFEVCRQIKQDRYLKDTKILTVTGYDSEEHRKKIMDAGTDDYLAKPMDVKIFYEKICKLLNIERK
jgi:CheY-like chemotaxis protein